MIDFKQRRLSVLGSRPGSWPFEALDHASEDAYVEQAIYDRDLPSTPGVPVGFRVAVDHRSLVGLLDEAAGLFEQLSGVPGVACVGLVWRQGIYALEVVVRKGDTRAWSQDDKLQEAARLVGVWLRDGSLPQDKTKRRAS